MCSLTGLSREGNPFGNDGNASTKPSPSPLGHIYHASLGFQHMNFGLGLFSDLQNLLQLIAVTVLRLTVSSAPSVSPKQGREESQQGCALCFQCWNCPLQTLTDVC